MTNINTYQLNRHSTRLESQASAALHIMDEKEAFNAIDPAAFDSLLREYPNFVPSKLSKLDHERYDNIPELLKQRPASVSLSKNEVATLVDWKL